MIAARTKAALQAAKARGVRLGRNGADRLSHEYREDAAARARELAPVFEELQSRALSVRAMARELNDRGIVPLKGGKWHAVTVQRVLARLSAQSA